MPFRPPLTDQQLHDIFQRQDAADITPLLWEIKRLRAIVLRAHQMQESMSPNADGANGIIYAALRSELKGEPCVEEHKRLADSVR